MSTRTSSRSARSKGPGLVGWLVLSGVIVLADQLTKLLILERFRFGERLAVLPGYFDLTLVFNTGAAFSFLADAGGWQRWFFLAIGLAASAFILYLLARHGSQKLFGRSAVKLTRVIALIDLKPYFHGRISLSGAPNWLRSGLP